MDRVVGLHAGTGRDSAAVHADGRGHHPVRAIGASMMHVAEATVLTWQPDGMPRGLITGRFHVEQPVISARPTTFEVDHIVRFPDTEPGDGARMCADLLPVLVERYRLGCVLVKIHDDYRPVALTAMARAFGFERVGREGALTIWRKRFTE